jgi:hypothetical protein
VEKTAQEMVIAFTKLVKTRRRAVSTNVLLSKRKEMGQRKATATANIILP